MSTAKVKVARRELREQLEARRRQLAEEILDHPRPITGCDVHFNRMLEERARIAEELARLDEQAEEE